jgi:hypothetical protein
MEYRLAEGVIFDTEAETQSAEYYEWFNAQIMPRLGGASALPCTRDRFGRPIEWRAELDEATLVITREYLADNGSWAMRGDSVTIIGKEVQDGDN